MRTKTLTSPVLTGLPATSDRNRASIAGSLDELSATAWRSDMLLSFCSDMAAVRTSGDLARVIKVKLKDVFNIRDYGILIINGSKQAWNYFIYDSDASFTEKPEFTDFMNGKFDIHDPLFNRILKANASCSFKVSELKAEEAIAGHLYCWSSLGLEYAMGFPVRIADEQMGVLFLQQERPGGVPGFEYDLVKTVATQISIAISNVMANEEISRRESERELLLSLNMAIASIRDNDDLLLVINRRLKALLTFNHTMIAIINSDRLTVSSFLLDSESVHSNQQRIRDIREKKHPLRDGLMQKAISSPVPVIFDLQIRSKIEELPDYMKLQVDKGAQQVVIARFSKGEEVFGFWMLFFDHKIRYDKSDLSLLEGLANQMSIAVSNIIANNEIQKREQEKSRILAFSNAIASVQDKTLLGKVLKRQLKNLLHIEDYVIHALSEDKKTYQPVLFDPDSHFAGHPKFAQLINQESSVNDGIFHFILATDEALSFSAANWFNPKPLPVHADVAKGIGSTTVTGVAIRMGKENIGIMIFPQGSNSHTGVEENLFRCVCSQLAITVSNLIANERLNKQLCEIKKYKSQLEEEKSYLKEEIESIQNYAELIGESQAMKRVFRLIEQVAHSDASVLLLGETGTGKELIARAIHNSSSRRGKLMVKVNCAALPASLVESELFGHERGSFTGATERRLGKFELANNGTLFLDEIGEMPMDLQVKLLRALQEREIERVGGSNVIKVNVRVIAATNRNLEKEMAEGRFRRDLYYRLNVFPIELPPLRERKHDIPELANYFIKRYAAKAGKPINAVSNKVLDELMEYSWPGNIRELEHLIERSVLLATGDTIKSVYLPVPRQIKVTVDEQEEITVRTIDENERSHILATLKYCRGRIAGEGGAAQLLGVPSSTLNSKMKKLNIRKQHMA